MSRSNNSDNKWELLYWNAIKDDGKNHMIGRGEFVRLMFVAAGVEFEESFVTRGSNYVMGYCHFGNQHPESFPAFAPPILKRGDFVLSQTPAILKYLGKEFGMAYDDSEPELVAHCDQVMFTITDFIAEGRLCFHAKDPWGSYYLQQDETAPYVKKFAGTRLPKWLSYLERVMKFNKDSDFVVGPKFTYVDVALMHVLMAAQSQFSDEYNAHVAADGQRLQAFLQRMTNMPRIKAYLESDKRGFFEGNSMM